MVLTGLSETEEKEVFAWDAGNREVLNHEFAVQVLVKFPFTRTRRLKL